MVDHNGVDVDYIDWPIIFNSFFNYSNYFWLFLLFLIDYIDWPIPPKGVGSKAALVIGTAADDYHDIDHDHDHGDGGDDYVYLG